MTKWIALFLSLIFAGCGSGAASSSSQPIAIYNQAYQENYQADSIDSILSDASNAYVVVDPFDANITEYIYSIKSNHNEVAGYISVGTGETYRDDYEKLKPYLTSTAWPDWPDEFFVSEVTTGILRTMKKRIDKMDAWGLDWVEFDNMDWLNEDSRGKYSLKASAAEAKSYISTLCDYTHSKGMKCMAKNTVNGFENFDGILYESYSNNKNWWDNAGMKSFLESKKLVIVNHYNEADCDSIYEEYKNIYSDDRISFICEDKLSKKYKHYNQL